VEVIQIDDFLEVNDFTLVIDDEQLEWLRSGISVYSLRKEWDRERLARALNDKALRAYDENSLAEALRLIDTAIQLTGRSFAYLFNNKGLISWKMGLTDQAKKDFLDAIELDTSNGDPYFNLGLIYFDELNHDSALKYLGRAVEISPSDSQFLTELGHLYLELDREDEAFELFDKATTTNPNDPQADFHLGYYHLYKKNQPRRAVEFYGRGLRKDPDDQFALADYAVAQWTAGNKRKALGIRRLLQDHPQLMPYTVSRLVYLNLEMGDYENALKYYRHALNLSDPFEPEWLHYYAAVACVKTDRIQEALDLLKLAIGAGGDAVIQRALAEKDLRTLTGTAAFKSFKKSPGKGSSG
jgi:tetratricopeptide (TPR) repeat protein